MLATDPGPLRMFQTEALYHAQVDYTCQLLSVVDEVADPAVAALITAGIYDRLAGDAAAEAAQRLRDAREMYDRLASEAPSPRALHP